MTVHPLEDPTYVPEHLPVNGEVPDVVEKWGAASQLRWFERFQSDLKPQKHTTWARFYVESSQHRGMCCPSCIDDGDYLELASGEPACCCEALRAEDD